MMDYHIGSCISSRIKLLLPNSCDRKDKLHRLFVYINYIHKLPRIKFSKLYLGVILFLLAKYLQNI